MKRMIRKWLGLPTYNEDGPSPSVPIREVLDGAEMALVAYRIDNGYLLRMGGGLTLQTALIYCADEKEMAEKIVVHRARTKITGAPSVIAGATYHPQKTNKY